MPNDSNRSTSARRSIPDLLWRRALLQPRIDPLRTESQVATAADGRRLQLLLGRLAINRLHATAGASGSFVDRQPDRRIHFGHRESPVLFSRWSSRCATSISTITGASGSIQANSL